MERSQVLDKGERAKSYERNVFQTCLKRDMRPVYKTYKIIS